jgi:hypothetical protein
MAGQTNTSGSPWPLANPCHIPMMVFFVNSFPRFPGGNLLHVRHQAPQHPHAPLLLAPLHLQCFQALPPTQPRSRRHFVTFREKHGRMARVAMDSLKFHPGPLCPTLLRLAGGSPLKRPYGRFRSGPPAGRAASGCLLHFWTPHAIRLWEKST